MVLVMLVNSSARECGSSYSLPGHIFRIEEDVRHVIVVSSQNLLLAAHRCLHAPDIRLWRCRLIFIVVWRGIVKHEIERP
jgi:hypothetical protein